MQGLCLCAFVYWFVWSFAEGREGRGGAAMATARQDDQLMRCLAVRRGQGGEGGSSREAAVTSAARCRVVKSAESCPEAAAGGN